MIELTQYTHMVVEPRNIITPFLSDLDLLKIRCSTRQRVRLPQNQRPDPCRLFV